MYQKWSVKYGAWAFRKQVRLIIDGTWGRCAHVSVTEFRLCRRSSSRCLCGASVISGDLCVFAVFWGLNSCLKTLNPSLFWGLNSLDWKMDSKDICHWTPINRIKPSPLAFLWRTAKFKIFLGLSKMTDNQAHFQTLVNISVETYQMLLKATILWVSAAALLGHLFNPLCNFNLQIGLRRSLRDAWRNVLTAGVKRLIRALKTLLGLSFSIKGLKGKGDNRKGKSGEGLC